MVQNLSQEFAAYFKQDAAISIHSCRKGIALYTKAALETPSVAEAAARDNLVRELKIEHHIHSIMMLMCEKPFSLNSFEKHMKTQPGLLPATDEERQQGLEEGPEW